MRKILTGFLILSCSLLLNAQAEDFILINGNIYTVNDQQPWAQAMVISEGVIEYVGENEKAKEYLNMETELVDLEGKLVLPGFHDVHMHPLEAYASPQSICELKGGQSIRRHLQRIEGCFDEQKDDEWFIGWGHWIDDIISSREMPRKLLDELITDKPAVIFSLSSHSNWVNSAALERIGWDADSPNPTGGIIVKDIDSGEPNGILFDNAADMINELIYEPTDQNLENAYLGLTEVMQELSANGITSIADARVYWSRKHHEVWLRAEQENTLQTRTVLDLWAYPQVGDEQIETLKSLYKNDKNSLLRISEIKTYSDGLISNTTAAMKQPYDVDFEITDDNLGLNYLDQNRLTKFITELEQAGFNFMIHAIGDRGVHEALNAIEAARSVNSNLNPRHRITHLDLIDNEDLPRFKELDVIADFQFAGEWTHPSEYDTHTSIFIKDRIANAYRVADLYAAGATITLSSDFDVSDMNPFAGIQNVMTRGDQSLPTLEAAIEAYTLNSAYALDQEDISGSLEVGKYADLVVLDQNIFEIPKDQIATTKVLWTLLEGEEMFRHPDW